MNISSIRPYQSLYANNYKMNNNIRPLANQIAFRGDDKGGDKGGDKKPIMSKQGKITAAIAAASIVFVTALGGIFSMHSDNEPSRRTNSGSGSKSFAEGTYLFETMPGDAENQEFIEDFIINMNVDPEQIELVPNGTDANGNPKKDMAVYGRFDYIEDEINNVKQEIYHNSKDKEKLAQCYARIEKLREKRAIQKEYAIMNRDGDTIRITLELPISLEDFRLLFDIKEQSLSQYNTNKNEDVVANPNWFIGEEANTESGKLEPGLYTFSEDDMTGDIAFIANIDD